ncbi:MAG: pyruvate kinase [Lewinellaceae bacterium]|nr:pyruvate kinase [Lewinellaceae bacterium]
MMPEWSVLRETLANLRQKMLATETEHRAALRLVCRPQRKSAANLLHYLTLRREDLRDLQLDLHDAGLSSLASSESHALFQVEAVLERLGAAPSRRSTGYDYPAASRLLSQRATSLFGIKRNLNIPHVMVTFDHPLADDYEAVKALLEAGMNVARINCAHDKEPVWRRMAENIRKATRITGLPCKIYMDLAGPKIRTVILGKGKRKGRIKLKKGERFVLAEPGTDVDKTKKIAGCTQPGVVKDLRNGDRVLFDDGLIETVVEKTDGKTAQLFVRRIPSEKTKLKAEKGINFPDTELSFRSLTDFDKGVLPFAKQYADVVGFSFVRHPDEVAELQTLLRSGKGRRLPIVLKIETLDAVQKLPALMLQGMQEPLFWRYDRPRRPGRGDRV